MLSCVAMGHREFWQERWESSSTPWDLGGPHPMLARLHGRARRLGGLQPEARVYVPGCGNAHDCAAFADWGHTVVGADYAPAAIASAKTLYGDHERVTLEVADALVVPEDQKGGFGAIYDRAMFCAIAPQARPDFIAACADRLQPRGLFMGLLFGEVKHDGEGPPHAVSSQDMQGYMAGRFTLVHLEEYPFAQANGVITREILGVWVKV